jgi:hypothetical protein
MAKTLAKAAEKLPRVPINNLIHQTQQEWSEGERLHRQWSRLRITIGFRLLELRARIESGEEGDQDWWQWFEAHFKDRSRRGAERLMEDAKADDPEMALAQRRTYNAEKSKEYRDRQRQKLEAAEQLRLTSVAQQSQPEPDSEDESEDEPEAAIAEVELRWPANPQLIAAPRMDKGIARRIRIDSARAGLAGLWAGSRGADSPRGPPM